MKLSPGDRLGPYAVIASLGSGGMGEVYRARDSRLNRDVAIKVLPSSVSEDPGRKARFAREAQAISQLSHPNICAIFDVGEDVDKGGGSAFLVMEYIDGESLAERLRRGPVPWTTAVPWAIQMAAAIDAAHKRGIVHRDLKPANVMIAESGVKLLDFGLAKLVEGSAAAVAMSGSAPTESLTGEQRLIGTVNYMSPEQLEGLEIDGRTDLFALGTTLYEMLTARKAFDGQSTASVTAAILTSDPPALAATSRTADAPLVPGALDHIVRRALAKDPNDRWQTARDMMLELQAVLDGRLRAPRFGAPSGPKRNVSIAAAAVALALVSGLLGWMLRPAGPVPAPQQAASIFTVTAPEGTHLQPGYGLLAVSPDARKIAFLAGTPSGPLRIWLRHLDSLEARPLSGTEGANNPFWSPDSQSIGFSRDRRLERIAIAGGPPVVITNTTPRGAFGGNPFGLWTPDGTILFTDWALERVSASGGTPVTVAEGDPAKGEAAITLLAPLTNGRFLSMMQKLNREGELRIGAVDGPLDVRLPDVRSNADYAQGYLLYRLSDTLVAQRFDDRALRLDGQPVPIVHGIQYNPGNARTVFSASGHVLAYRAELPRRLTWRDREGRPAGTIGEAGRDWNPVVAPDGSGRVVVDRFNPATARFGLWTIDAQGRSTAVTQGAHERFGAWSPDGLWIAYLAIGSSEIRRTNLATGQDELLVRGNSNSGLFPLDWSRDGKLLIYATGGRQSGDLWMLRVGDQAGTPQRLTETTWSEFTARLSPDGRWLAYSSDEQGGRNVWVQAFPGGEGKRQISKDGGHNPTWRADGREMFYMTPGGTMMAAPVNVETGAIGTPAKLFQANPGLPLVPRDLYAATPDGQRFLVSEISGLPDAFTVIVNWTSLIK